MSNSYFNVETGTNGEIIIARLHTLILELEVITERGYVHINRRRTDHDEIKLHFAMVVECIKRNPKVHENAGKIALQYGPLVLSRSLRMLGES
ncbi:beta-L-arabinofuranosidase domain-containing protein [Paenibacillus sp. Soil766]|uniref:beta-L-arabinofuranosidase domain-containing protein n=1 Tax=Paenibacillus sp. Soil766 TaxID=1736404 RepID=UPI00138F19B0|nr:beta-L-arabinofuranosidase domain-containing protein [Paenibacillus sp. Soil766]